MRQLSGTDANFLHMETATTFGHVCSVSALEPSTTGLPVTLDALRSLIERRLPLLPQFRQRLVEVPLGIDRPYWVDDPAFDLDFHVREVALPAPGDSHQLAEQAARIAGRPLDRSRPLWEIYLIHGLADGQLAMMAKFHHAAVDGIAGAEVMSTLLDSTPDAAEAPRPSVPPVPARPPGLPRDGEMFVRGLVGLATQPLKLFQFQQRVLATLPRSAMFFGRQSLPMLQQLWDGLATAGTGGGDGHVLNSPVGAAPRTPFNRAITPHRRWAYGTASLDTVKTIKNFFGVTVNDVVMAACARALRRWLQVHQALPARPLVAMVPLSVRSADKRGEIGNQVSAMMAPLPTHLPDPAERVRSVHEAMRSAKEQHKAIGAETLQDATQFAMPALAARAARVAAQLRIFDVINPPVNIVISNVPGPRSPLYLAGAKLTGYYPLSVVSDGQGLNITVQSYLDGLDFGLVACRELVPDLWDLMGFVLDAVDELAALVQPPARGATSPG